ncbi:MAG: (Fe-S)-binding protein [Proteobacteria bacterium]|nr:(Fe-S)-binding protein [Pseudomonadota bacterium]
MLAAPGPRAERTTLRDLLPPCGPNEALVLEPAEAAGSLSGNVASRPSARRGEHRSGTYGPVREHRSTAATQRSGGAAISRQAPSGTVLYFPGCGSERLYGSIGLAALHVLQTLGLRVVLPPPFLCCGFPAWANAARVPHGRQTLRDTIVFSQIREMLAHLSFEAVVVTCGTCHEALGGMEAQKIFGAPVVDLLRLAHDRGLRLRPPEGALLYHTPCHDGLQGRAPALLAELGGYRLEPIAHCCSEAGTLALSRPDIANAMLHRKRTALLPALAARPAPERPAVVLTTCPSCISGLGRNAALGVEPRHVAVELAAALSGAGWRETARTQCASAQALRF